MIAIAAVSANGVIGNKGSLPWHLPADLRFFKQTTLGHIVLMGRRTFDSLPRPLPGRENWVVTSRPLHTQFSNVRAFPSPQDVPKISPDDRCIFLIGGASLYSALLPTCSDLLLTYIYDHYDGDTLLPPIPASFQLQSILHREAQFEIRHYTNLLHRSPNYKPPPLPPPPKPE
ncbi:MAG: dihydrofolate reductase [Chthoniobacterales bacterium]|nr:dihydrofolate reductase [Chthoniobacterales bacterium]MCX7713797.1 dihydrofolate reductase [Chthoniobacterales bacterium]